MPPRNIDKRDITSVTITHVISMHHIIVGFLYILHNTHIERHQNTTKKTTDIYINYLDLIIFIHWFWYYIKIMSVQKTHLALSSHVIMDQSIMNRKTISICCICVSVMQSWLCLTAHTMCAVGFWRPFLRYTHVNHGCF